MAIPCPEGAFWCVFDTRVWDFNKCKCLPSNLPGINLCNTEPSCDLIVHCSFSL